MVPDTTVAVLIVICPLVLGSKPSTTATGRQDMVAYGGKCPLELTTSDHTHRKVMFLNLNTAVAFCSTVMFTVTAEDSVSSTIPSSRRR